MVLREEEVGDESVLKHNWTGTGMKLRLVQKPLSALLCGT